MADTTGQLTDEQKVDNQLAILVEGGALSVIEQSNALTVTDIATKERSVALETQAKLEKKRYLEILDPFVQGKHEAHKKATTTRTLKTQDFDTVIKAEGEKRATYTHAENERLQKEAQERADIEAQERAERLKVIQADIAEIVAGGDSTEETLSILQLMLEEEGITDEKAEMLRSQIEVEIADLEGLNRAAAEEAAKAQAVAAAPPPPVAAVAAPATKGEVTGWTYTVTVVAPNVLCQAIADGKVPIAAIKFMDGKLKSYAKDGMELPGCHIDKKPSSHTRG